MNPVVHAIRVGVYRGWVDFKLSLVNAQDIWFYLSTCAGTMVYLFLNRNETIGDTGLLLPTVVLPSVIGAFVAFGGLVGPAYSLAAEREDGTLLRLKAIPHGMAGYVSGQVLFQSLSALPALALLILPGMFLFDGVMQGSAAGWILMPFLLVLGLLATLPFGMILGSLIKTQRTVGMWATLPAMVLVGISGIFYPLSELPGVGQAVAQVFPVYWLGLGMRSVFLPDSAAAVEIAQSWRTLEALGVLGLWAAVGLVLAPIVLRRMARRESGSLLEARRQEALQRVN
jgi:ABC-2 type transport system permease protein